MKPIRILLIKPFQPTALVTCMPPLGLLYLVSCLRERLGADVEVQLRDLYLTRTRYDEIEPIVREFQPDVVGFSSLNWESEECCREALVVKEKFPEVLVALGGSFAHKNTPRIRATGIFDWIFDGEADLAFPIAVERWFRGDRRLDDIVGLTWRKADGTYQNNAHGMTPGKPMVGVVENLDDLPFPAWDLVDFDAYARETNMNVMLRAKRYAPLFTSRGCPYLCTYCHDVFGKRFRWRSPENVAAEVKLLREKYGVGELEIVDDIFNMNSERMKAVCRLIAPYGMKICFPNGLRFDIMDREDVEALVEAGTYAACVAVETVTPRLQELIKKRLKPERTLQAINWMAERGVVVRGFFMLGFPTETREEIQATIDFACRSQLTQAYFFHVTPQPGTPLYDAAAEVNADAIEDQLLQEYNGVNTWYAKAYNVDVDKIKRRAYMRFYLTSPRRMWRLIRGMRLRDLLRNTYFFLRIVLRLDRRPEEPLPEALQPLAQLTEPDEVTVTSASLLRPARGSAVRQTVELESPLATG